VPRGQCDGSLRLYSWLSIPDSSSDGIFISFKPKQLHKNKLKADAKFKYAYIAKLWGERKVVRKFQLTFSAYSISGVIGTTLGMSMSRLATTACRLYF
jgi:hypothetical protein